MTTPTKPRNRIIRHHIALKCITDLRSARSIIKALKKIYPYLNMIHVSDEVETVIYEDACKSHLHNKSQKPKWLSISQTHLLCITVDGVTIRCPKWL